MRDASDSDNRASLPRGSWGTASLTRTEGWWAHLPLNTRSCTTSRLPQQRCNSSLPGGGSPGPQLTRGREEPLTGLYSGAWLLFAT
jgi:hypothetical protein